MNILSKFDNMVVFFIIALSIVNAKADSSSSGNAQKIPVPVINANGQPLLVDVVSLPTQPAVTSIPFQFKADCRVVDGNSSTTCSFDDFLAPPPGTNTMHIKHVNVQVVAFSSVTNVNISSRLVGSFSGNSFIHGLQTRTQDIGGVVAHLGYNNSIVSFLHNSGFSPLLFCESTAGIESFTCNYTITGVFIMVE